MSLIPPGSRYIRPILLSFLVQVPPPYKLTFERVEIFIFFPRRVSNISISPTAIMSVSRILAVVLLSSGSVRAWSMTNYYNYSTQVFGSTTLSQIVTVTPTGPVTGTSSIVATSITSDDAHVKYNYTVTSLFLEPTASWCVPGLVNVNTKVCTGTQGQPSIPTTKPNSLLYTRYYAPLLIAQPSTCTQTSFSYTSSREIYPNQLPSSMGTQATESASVTFISTNFGVNTNLGGQAVTTTVVEIYLIPNAVQNVNPGDEARYLTQCVDPSSFLCSAPTPALLAFGCGPQPITYPPRAQATGGTTAQPTSTSGSGATPATTSTKSGAQELHRPGPWSICLAVATLAMVMLV